MGDNEIMARKKFKVIRRVCNICGKTINKYEAWVLNVEASTGTSKYSHLDCIMQEDYADK